MSKLNKPQRKALQNLVSYRCFKRTGAYGEPSVIRGLSNRSYSNLKKRGLIDEQWGGFASWRPFIAITVEGEKALEETP